MNNIRKETIRVACRLALTGVITIAEGGDFVLFINQIDIASQIRSISTGSGVSLASFNGKPLPAIEILTQAKQYGT